jgi:hypothetical protein
MNQNYQVGFDEPRPRFPWIQTNYFLIARINPYKLITQENAEAKHN